MAKQTTFTENEYFAEKFKGLILSGQILDAITFEDCTFIDCDFSQAILSKCQFIGCQFIKCNLSVINIAYSTFSALTFTGCKLIGIDWGKAIWPELALSALLKFEQCIINDNSFFGLNIPGISITRCKAHDVDFREGNFSQANFTGTNFSNSLFSNTNLGYANFTAATDYNIGNRSVPLLIKEGLGEVY